MPSLTVILILEEKDLVIKACGAGCGVDRKSPSPPAFIVLSDCLFLGLVWISTEIVISNLNSFMS